MITIYDDYDDEPEDIFKPLPAHLASAFYALEMDSYTADIDFFNRLLPKQGLILELGCGTGRMTRRLAATRSSAGLVVGIDISLPMLQQAGQAVPADRSAPKPWYLCMDMTSLAFTRRFSAILIPYNTLNLLNRDRKISQCLKSCRDFLEPDGKLLVQLFVPAQKYEQQPKTFQFQILEPPQGGKVIKEIRKEYLPKAHLMRIEERFRVRPMRPEGVNEDWHQIYTITAYPATRWLAIFDDAGFLPSCTWGDYDGRPYAPDADSMLLASFTLQ